MLENLDIFVLLVRLLFKKYFKN